MAFQIKIKYHERTEAGEYNKTETKEATKKVGDSFDEYPLEKLASYIMGQLARRDIWVVDVEIYEFVKQQVSFRECTDGRGIVLKNKKFTFGKSDTIAVEEVNTSPPALPQPNVNLANTNLAQSGLNLAPKRERVLSYVTFEPAPLPPPKNCKLTIGKKYPVYGMHKSSYTIMDDTGTKVQVGDRYFVAVAEINLQRDREGDRFTERKEEGPKLLYSDQMMDDARVAAMLKKPGQIDRSKLPPHLRDIPVDGEIPVESFKVPDIRGR